jgi:hypothetical protein
MQGQQKSHTRAKSVQTAVDQVNVQCLVVWPAVDKEKFSSHSLRCDAHNAAAKEEKEFTPAPFVSEPDGKITGL